MTRRSGVVFGRLLVSVCALAGVVGLASRPSVASQKQDWQAVAAPLVAGNGDKRMWLGVRNIGQRPKVICDRFNASFAAAHPDGGMGGGSTSDYRPCDPLSSATRLEPGQTLMRPVRLPDDLPSGRVKVVITAWELTDSFPFGIAHEISISGAVDTGR